MSLRLRLASKNKKLSGLTLAMDRVREQTKQRLLDVSEYALTTAVEHTPKYSGAATEGWYFSRFPRSGYSTVRMYGVDGPPTYEGGIDDPKARALNAAVIAREMAQLREYVDNAVGNDAALTLYLVNAEAYSYQWLATDTVTASGLLRAQNQDFYTMQDIHHEVSAYKAGFGFY